MKDREKQPDNAPKRLHTTAQYSLEDLLIRAQTEPSKEGEGSKREKADLPSLQPSRPSRPEPSHKDRSTDSVSVDQREEMLEAVEQAFTAPAVKEPLPDESQEPSARLWKNWSGKVKRNKTVQTLRRKIEQVRKDDQPDEMEQIYGDRPMLTPISEGGQSQEKPIPQFAYLFRKEEGEGTEDGGPTSFFQIKPQPRPEMEATGGDKQNLKQPLPDKQTGEDLDSGFPSEPAEIDAQDRRKGSPVEQSPELEAVDPRRGRKDSQPGADGSGSSPVPSAAGEKKLSRTKPDLEKKPVPTQAKPRPTEDWSSLSRKLDSKRGAAGPAIQEKDGPSHSHREGSRHKRTGPVKEQSGKGPIDKDNSPVGKEEVKISSSKKKREMIESDQPMIKKKIGIPSDGKQGSKRIGIEPEPSPKKTAQAQESRYEKLFGKPQPAKSEKTPTQGKKKRKGERPTAQLFAPKASQKAILLDVEEDMREVLQDEYEEYRRAQKDEPELAEPASGKGPDKKHPVKGEGKPQKDKFSIFGEMEPDDGTEEETPCQELPALEDYTHPEDSFSVKAELIDHMSTVIVRTAITAIAAILSIAAVVLFCVDLPFAQALKGNAYWYLAANLALLGIAAGFSYVPMGGGMKALFRFKGNSDSAIAFATWIALIHGAAAFFTPQAYLDGGLNVYGCLATLGLFLNSWGKLVLVRRVYANFKYVSSPEKKYAVKIVSDERLANKLCRGMGLEKSIVAYQRPVGFLSNFLRLSYEPDPSEKLAGKIAPVGALAALAVGAGAYLFTQDVQSALAALSISACVCVPMCCVPAVNLLIRGVSKRALRMGSMLVGFPGVRQFADTNAVVLDAGQLYPGNSVVLHGIKGFSGERIDQAILEAGAVMSKAKAPMAATFDQIIQGKGELLPKVDSVSYEDERGVVGWVGGRRVLVGNRKLLEEHGVTPPEQSLEDQYKQNGRQVTYLATAGELKALFVTSYIPDEKMMAQMQRLEALGVCFLIRTSDPNITERMVSDHFQVYYRSVRVLPEDLSEEFVYTPEKEKETARAYLATKGRATVMQRMIASCIRVRNKITLSLVLQVFAVVVNFLLVAFMIFASGLGQLGSVEMLIYTLFWVLAVLIVPCIRRA